MTQRPLRRGNWSVQELERLRLLFPRRGAQATAALLRRSPDSVRRKALDLLRVPPRRGPWTAADDDLLRQSYGVLELRFLGLLLGRSPGDVTKRAAVLRASLRSGAWSRAEDALLKDLYGTRNDHDLEVCLQRSASDIAQRAVALCLAKDKRFVAAAVAAGAAGLPRRMPRWRAEEIEQLRRAYPDHDNLEVARLLGRSVTSVANKANQLGLHKSPEFLARIGRANVAVRYGKGSSTAVAGEPGVAAPDPAASAES